MFIVTLCGVIYRDEINVCETIFMSSGLCLIILSIHTMILKSQNLLRGCYSLFPLWPVVWTHMFLLIELTTRNGSYSVLFNNDNIFNAINKLCVNRTEPFDWCVKGT